MQWPRGRSRAAKPRHLPREGDTFQVWPWRHEFMTTIHEFKPSTYCGLHVRHMIHGLVRRRCRKTTLPRNSMFELTLSRKKNKPSPSVLVHPWWEWSISFHWLENFPNGKLPRSRSLPSLASRGAGVSNITHVCLSLLPPRPTEPARPKKAPSRPSYHIREGGLIGGLMIPEACGGLWRMQSGSPRQYYTSDTRIKTYPKAKASVREPVLVTIQIDWRDVRKG